RAQITAHSMYGGEKHSYQIKDAKGKELLSGKPKANEVIELNFTPPAPGMYFLDYFDGAANLFSLKIPAEQIVVLPLGPNVMATSLYGATQDLFLYVPKG